MRFPILEGGRHEGPKVQFSLSHHYNEGIEFVYIQKGQAVWMVEDRAIPVRAGDLFFTLPWERHGGVERVQWGLHLDWAVLDVGETTGRLQQPAGLNMPPEQWAGVEECLLNTDLRCLPVPPEVGELVYRIFQDASSREARAPYHLQVLLSLFLLDLCALIQTQHSHPTSDQALPVKRIQQWLDQISAHPEQSVPLEEMAAGCGLKRTRFSMLVKSITGDSPINFINRLRIQKACQLLVLTELSITDIAFECGFESSQYFARIFRSFLDCSPSVYRQRQKGSAPKALPVTA